MTARPRRSGVAPGTVIGALLGVVLGASAAFIGIMIARPGDARPRVHGALGDGRLDCLGDAAGRDSAAPGRADDALDEDPAGSSGAAASSGMLVERIDRRSFLLRMGAATALVTVSGTVVGALASGRRRPAGTPWSSDHRLPNTSDPTVPAAGTRVEITPVREHYRTDIDTIPTRVGAGNWRLRVGGLIGDPRELTLQQIREGYPQVHQFVTLACISNPVGGEPLRDEAAEVD